MNEYYDRLRQSVEYIGARAPFRPKAALVLGSGLGGYADSMEVAAAVPYADIPGFPVSTVAGHEGRFIFGRVRGYPIVAMKGRVHHYEGYSVEDAVMPVRAMGLLGAETLILTNAAGGIDLSFRPGDLMIITDHISSFVRSPLIGPNSEELGPRFPDMSRVYDPGLIMLLRKAAGASGIDIKEGIYLQTTGPQFETPAEIRAFRLLGASAVGMSTVIEAIAARHMGMRVSGVSCISNMAAGILDQPLGHGEVQETAARVSDSFGALISAYIEELGSRISGRAGGA